MSFQQGCLESFKLYCRAMMKKVQLNHPLFEELPTPIIWDMLSRLPTKVCFNCKLVCKDWYRIIIDPEFADLRSSSCFYLTLWLHGKFDNRRCDFLLLDLDKSSMVDEMGHLNVNVDSTIKYKSELITLHHKLSVVNECNGLICLKSREMMWNPYIICNILTGQQVIVGQIREPSCSVVSYGLGCCPVSHKFKVLRIVEMENDKNVASIQTLGSNEWRVIGNAPLIDQLHGDKIAPFLHGSLYRYSYKDNRIWSFHFGNEQFVQVPTPDGVNNGYGRILGVTDSCLCFSSTSKTLCEIWLMKEYGVKGSWVKQFMFHTEYTPCRPLLQMGNGDLLVTGSSCSNLGACDTESGSYRTVKIHGVSFFRVMVCHAKFS